MREAFEQFELIKYDDIDDTIKAAIVVGQAIFALAESQNRIAESNGEIANAIASLNDENEIARAIASLNDEEGYRQSDGAIRAIAKAIDNAAKELARAVDLAEIKL